MLYEKEVNDLVLIQFIIMFTLKCADEPLAYQDLVNVIMTNCNINYNDFQLALTNLTDTKHIESHRVSNRVQKYQNSQKGQYASDSFRSYIPVYIRDPIIASLKDLFKNKRLEESVKSKITPINTKGEYQTDVQLFDEDKTQLLNLSLYAGTREEAERMARYFKKNSGKIYESILNAFQEEEKKSF